METEECKEEYYNMKVELMNEIHENLKKLIEELEPDSEYEYINGCAVSK